MASQTRQVRKMIRFLALSFLILAIFIDAPTAKGDVSFDLSIASKESYISFISQLRKALPTTGKASNISVLPSTVPDSKLFTLINITNYDDKTITVAFNVTNVYAVAYRTGNVSYFFSDTPLAAFKLLFQGTQQNTLPYTGNYDKLQTAARKIRDQIPLGLPSLDSAITNLFHFEYRSTAMALLVLIQSTAEAARFKYIEQEVSNHSTTNFLPNEAIISLENNWGALSKQIQIAQTRNGEFQTPVDLIRPGGGRFQVTNVSSKVVKGNIALLLYYKVSVANDNNIPIMLRPGAIRMPIVTPTNGLDEP